MRPFQRNQEEDVYDGGENPADESDILSDQDETQLASSADQQEENMGGDGSEDLGLDEAQFARGEIDVKEAMDRAADTLVPAE